MYSLMAISERVEIITLVQKDQFTLELSTKEVTVGELIGSEWNLLVESTNNVACLHSWIMQMSGLASAIDDNKEYLICNIYVHICE